MPDELTVICKKTSRDKVVAGINIKFFSIYDIPAKKTQLCTYNSQSFITSTIEQTLIDFVAHYGINASCTQIGNLFFRLPYNIDLLIRTAATQSDTYLKRVMFYLAWSGRGTWKDFPAFLKKVPVKLFPKLDEKQAQTSWNGEIFIKYPTAIMLQAPEGDLPVIDTEIARRVEIVCYKPFREYFAKRSILPIFHAPYMAEQLPEFFMLMLSKANKDQNSFFEQLSADNRKPAFPAAFLEWLAKTACERKLPDWFVKAAETFLLEQIDTAEAENACKCVCLAMLLQLQPILIPKLKFVLDSMMSLNRHDLVAKFGEWAWTNNYLITVAQRLIYVAALIAIQKNHEAFQIICDTRQQKPGNRSQEDCASLAYFAACSHYSARQFQEAKTEIETCMPYYKKSGHIRYSGIGMIIAGINLANGLYSQAKGNILLAYKFAKSINKQGMFKLNALIGLAQIEYFLGNFQRMKAFARSAIRIIRKEQQHTFDFLMLKLLLAGNVLSGNLSSAFTYGIKLHNLGKQLGSDSCKISADISQAWVFALAGQFSAVNKILNKLDEIEIRQSHPQLFEFYAEIKITKLLLLGQLSSSLAYIEPLISSKTCSSVAPIKNNTLIRWLTIQGLLHTYLTDEAAAISCFERAKLLSASIDDCPETRLLVIITGSCFPNLVSTSELVKNLNALIRERFYHPFWFLYAGPLLERELPEGQKFVILQYSQTSSLLASELKKNYLFLRKLFRKLTLSNMKKRYLLIQNGQYHTVAREEYLRWQSKCEYLIFEPKTGKWSFLTETGCIKPGGNTHKIFLELLLAENCELSIEDLYASIWGGGYDEDFFRTAIFSALQRAKLHLQKISPEIHLWLPQKRMAKQFVTLKIGIPYCVLL